MSPKDTAYIVERLAVRFMSMVADYERKLVEHRDSFGVRTSADAKIIEGLRDDLAKALQEVEVQAESVLIEAAHRTAKELGHQCGESLIQAAHRVVKERDGLLTQVQDMRAEIERLQWENKTMHKDAEDGYAEAIKVLGDPIGLSKERDALLAEVAELKTKYSKLLGVCDFIRSYCEPCDPPPEASHITPEGKQTAEGALPQPGDVVRLVRVPTNDEYPHDSGRWEPNWGGIGDYMRVHYVGSNINGTRVVRAVFGLEWPLSCVEVVKGGDK